MLKSLSIKNYALINNIQVDFEDQLSIITGETGAGKSILLGGLSLVLGQRANANLVKQKDKKCIIEAEFKIDKYNLNPFFEKEDLDYEKYTTIRREILPNGKSRAFINDTPVNLQTLTSLSERLIDIHSQHQTLQLANKDYQFQIIDALANNSKHLETYRKLRQQYSKKQEELEQILEHQSRAKAQYDYQSFLFQELEASNLKADEQEILEEKLDKISHIEEIQQNLLESLKLADNEDVGLKHQMFQMKYNLTKIAGFDKRYQALSERVQSVFIELEDVVTELELEYEKIDFSQDELTETNDRLQLIYALQKKHQVNNIEALLTIQSDLKQQLELVEHADENVLKLQQGLDQLKTRLLEIGQVIRQNRRKAIPTFLKELHQILEKLEMQNTLISIDLIESSKFLAQGMDDLEFKISANKGLHFEHLKKAASGGEMSRIMLAVKSILCAYTNLPSIVFDEIDTGVSGEVANKIAHVMKSMGQYMQVITITHLPQIAAIGHQHYKVFKEERDDQINSNIKVLDPKERLLEIAEMLGGKSISDSALSHAKALLN